VPPLEENFAKYVGRTCSLRATRRNSPETLSLASEAGVMVGTADCQHLLFKVTETQGRSRQWEERLILTGSEEQQAYQIIAFLAFEGIFCHTARR
jgi:hypothetical protein